MTEETEHYTLKIRSAQAGERLDKCLAQALEGFSRSRVQALLEAGHVRLEGAGAVADASRKVKAGQIYHISVPPAAPTHMEGQDIPLDVVYEDADILILNKPPGLTVHPAPGHADGTLVNALIAHCGDSLSGIGGVARPGIVHRIDKDTSGLLAVAKHDGAHAALSAQLARRTLSRTYRALVWGVPVPTEGSIYGAIGRSPINRKKMAVLEKGGKEAVTHYKLLRAFSADGKAFASLVECRLETGRTHQIRVHFAHKGHALIGDPLYGGSSAGRLRAVPTEAREALMHFPRQALHAFRLGLVHPATGESMQWEALLPEDFLQLLKACEACATLR